MTATSLLSENGHPLEQTMEKAVGIIQPNFHLGWDLFLALIPLALALVIFRKHLRMSPVFWWPLLGVFVIFLPNAPYVLTDVIHFVSKVRVSPPLPIWAMSLLLLEFFVYFWIGMQSFVISLMLWGRMLKRHRSGWLVVPIELIILTLSAFGMYLGRYDRLNSWDLVTDPEKLMDQAMRDTLHQQPLAMTLVFLAVVTAVYYLLKFSNLLIAALLHNHTEHHDPHMVRCHPAFPEPR